RTARRHPRPPPTPHDSSAAHGVSPARSRWARATIWPCGTHTISLLHAGNSTREPTVVTFFLLMDACPACGGSGGGPFGPPNSAWDREDYVCKRCAGSGVI